MSVFAYRVTLIAACLFALVLTSCSGPAATKAETTNFYWSAAQETYASGDYMKAADHLEKVIEANNSFTDRAIPWYLVLTSGMADGYMKLADQYTAGARNNKSRAVAFRVKATTYRGTASRLALRFAQNVDRINQIPLGRLPLAFPLPKGNAEVPAVLASIAGGTELTPADADAAEALTIQHSVLMTACQAAGAPNDVAKTAEILSQSFAGTTRVTFGEAIAHLLDSEASLYTRNKLDDPDKLAIFHQRAQSVLVESAKAGSARLVQAGSVTAAAAQ
jgi:hypothetical protein